MVALSGLSPLPIREGCRVFGAGVGAPDSEQASTCAAWQDEFSPISQQGLLPTSPVAIPQVAPSDADRFQRPKCRGAGKTEQCLVPRVRHGVQEALGIRLGQDAVVEIRSVRLGLVGSPDIEPDEPGSVAKRLTTSPAFGRSAG